MVGDSALWVVPDEDFLATIAQSLGKPADLAALASQPELHGAVKSIIDQTNMRLAVIEQVRRFIIAEGPFTIDNGMLTPSMKIRRHVIKERYGQALDGLYGRGKAA